MTDTHIPVLLTPVLELFSEKCLKSFVDGTLGAGGHASALLSAHPELSRYLGIDRDPLALEQSRVALSSFGSRVVLERGRFSEMGRFASEDTADGILLDLGVSSMQLDRAGRGFTFREEVQLDMRMDPDQETTAADLLARLSERELATILREYGEVPAWRQAALAIVQARRRAPIRSTRDLWDALGKVGGLRRSKRLHPLTLVMQALRIAVNDELGELSRALSAATRLLAPGGRLIVISYHSGEDRVVKQFMRVDSRLQILTKRPLVPDMEECRTNPRSRSAKLRACELIA